MSSSCGFAILTLSAALMACQSAPPAKPPAQAATTSAAAPARCAPPGQTTAQGEPIGCVPPEIIQRIVRADFGRLRVCYEQGLERNPKLAGRIAVKFTINRDGTVREPTDAGSELPDAAVVACVVDGFRPMRFPAPDGGVVIVQYPIIFRPGG